MAIYRRYSDNWLFYYHNFHLLFVEWQESARECSLCVLLRSLIEFLHEVFNFIDIAFELHNYSAETTLKTLLIHVWTTRINRIWLYFSIHGNKWVIGFCVQRQWNKVEPIVVEYRRAKQSKATQRQRVSERGMTTIALKLLYVGKYYN